MKTENQGLWLLPRHDAGNSGRADLPARMPNAPSEVWHYGGNDGNLAFARPIGDEGFLVQNGRGVAFLDHEGRQHWNHPTLGVGVVVEVLDFNGDGRPEALVTLGKKGFALLDVATGRMLWTWTSPAGTYLVRYQTLKTPGGATLVVFPPFSMMGCCFDFAGTGGAPRLLWQKDFTGKYHIGYGPSIVLADMDNDGQPEIVIASKPACVYVLDLITGGEKFGIQYPIHDGPDIGRPYGLLQAVDLDGDGYRDIAVISTQVEEYLSILHNEGGKALQSVWSQFIEKDFPTDFKEVRANMTSVADVNGDGKPELVLGLFNTEGDNRWHTVVIDPMKDFTARLQDWPDRYFRGCHDLNGDGVPEIVTSPTRTRSVSTVATLEALDGRTGSTLATLDDTHLVTVAETLYQPARPHANDIVYYGAVRKPVMLTENGRPKGLLVKRTSGAAAEFTWRIGTGQNILEPFAVTPFERTLLYSDSPLELTRIPPSTRMAVSPTPAASCPLVSRFDGQRELVLALSNGTIIGGQPDFSNPGQFKSSWRVRGAMPSVWLGPEGQRVLCAADPDQDIILLYRQPSTDTPPTAISLPMPLNRNTGFTDSFPRNAAWLLPFGATTMRIFVGFRLNEHALACGEFDATGKLLWSDAERGPHPRTAAILDVNGDDRPSIIMDNHGMQYLYDEQGRHRMIAHCWGDTLPGRGDGCAHALPIAGHFGPQGAPRIFMSPGYSAMEVMDAGGNRLAQRALKNHYEFVARIAAAGRIRGDDAWDIGIVSEAGVFHAVDLETCQTRWTLDLGVPTFWPIAVTAGDLTGEGRDHFLVCLPNGELVALAERNGQGIVLWKKTFETGLWEALIADVDGDGVSEIIVQTDDGLVRILKG